MTPLLLLILMQVTCPQPDLDLPVAPSNYQAGTPAAPIPDTKDDPRDEPAPIFFGEEIESANDTIVYVIDVSGSMYMEDRLLRAKRELEKSIKGLPDSFKFNVISYDCTLTRLWPKLMPADAANKSVARQFVGTLGANSGTATGPGVALALADQQVKCVVLLTDGAPNCGANGCDGHRAMIRAKNTQQAVINVFGIDATGEYRAFCQNVAKDASGAYTDLP